MGAEYSFYVKTIETHARAFLTLNILAIGRVIRKYVWLQRKSIWIKEFVHDLAKFSQTILMGID